MNLTQLDESLGISELLKWEFGAELCKLFEDKTVIEIMLNPDGKLWVERLGENMEEIGTMAPSKAECLMGTLASLQKAVLTEKNPRISCREMAEQPGQAASIH